MDGPRFLRQVEYFGGAKLHLGGQLIGSNARLQARIDDLEMYYEVHGGGRPLVLLHGAYMTIDLMGPILRELAKTRQVIAVELQGLH